MDELAKRFADLAEKYGPDVAQAAKAAVRTEVYSTLVSSVIWLAFAVAMGLVARWLWRLKPRDASDRPIAIFGAVIASLIAAACGASFLWHWIDPWTWTALNHPELWLAKQAFHI